MKKRIILLLVAAAFILCTFTDFRCVEECLNKGYDYQLCAKQCSY